jgi:tetratricopeptide (TPR) repeat protein
VRYDVPNACNECHADKSADWALENVERWYPGRSVRPHLRATAFSLARQGDPRAVNSLVRLAGDHSENPEIRATAAGFLGRFPSDLSTQMLIALTKDKEPMIRVEAARALGGVPEQNPAIALTALLDDPYLAVRIHAAGSLTSPLFPRMTFSELKQKSFDKAVAEYRQSLEVEGDHPNVQERLGSLEFTLGNFADSRDAYRLALKLDPAFADAYVGLALLDIQAGNHEEAVRNARRAVEVSPGKDVYRKFLEKIQRVP